MVRLQVLCWFLSFGCLLNRCSSSTSTNTRNNIHSFENSLCPVLKALQPTDNYYYYPIDIYDQDYVAKTPRPNEKIVTCSATDIAGSFPETVSKVCSNLKVCPVHQEFLSLTAKNTKARSSVPLLCKITDTIRHNAAKLNFIILGGSVTGGVLAQGCNVQDNCKTDLQLKDPKEDRNRISQCVPCAWSHYLEFWLKKSFSSSIKVHNLALNAHGSAEMAERVYEQLSSVGIKQLTQHDVVFIDHSSNDANKNTAVRSERMTKGLETLIRKLYSYGQSHSLPTIILLGTERQNRQLVPEERWYTTTYLKIANYYNLTFWNFDDFYTSNYLQNANLTYTKYITHQNNCANGPHPPWHVQSFTADMIASMLNQEITECERISPSARAAIIKKYYIIDIKHLPPPLFAANSSEQCTTENELYSLSYDNLVSLKDTNSKMSGSWESKPLNAWQLRLDTHGRNGGFIHEFFNKELHTSSRSQKSTPIGTAISNTTDHNAELVFTLPLTKQHNQNIIVVLNIFRTYENAGVVSVFYCGKQLDKPNFSQLDALWADHASYRYSQPESFTFLLPSKLCDSGDVNRSQENRNSSSSSNNNSTNRYVASNITKRNENTGSGNNKSHQNVTFSLVHSKVDDGMPRGNQKFKVYSIRVCTTQDEM